jgi:hypothetical protein
MAKVTTRKAGTRKRYLDVAVDPATGEPGYLAPWRKWRAGLDGAEEPAHDVVDVVAVSIDGDHVATVAADDLARYLADNGHA